jgi:MFS family permease
VPAGDSVISATADRILCAAAVLLAVLMVILDMTVINVSLPYMMGTLGATPDQITWVLTSYIVAEGVVIPISGFLAERFGLCTDSLESCRVEGRAGREDKAAKQSSRPIVPPVMATTLVAARRRARQTLPTSSGSMAAMRRPSPPRFGTAVRATCRLGKVDCRGSTARFSLSMFSI